jgi:mucin-19
MKKTIPSSPSKSCFERWASLFRLCLFFLTCFILVPNARALDNTIYVTVGSGLYTLSGGTTTLVSALSFATNAAGRDITTGRIYYMESGAPYRVGVFDPLTNVDSILPGQLGFSTNRAALDNAGVLWVMDPANGNLHTVSKTTGLPSFFGVAVGIPNGGGGDIAFSSSGQLFVVVGNTLYAMTGLTATVVTTLLPAGGCPGLAFVDTLGPIVSCGANLLRVDVSTGAVTNVGSSLPAISDIAAITKFADMRITKTASTPIFLRSSNGSYTLGANNNGPHSASGPFTITDTLPTGLTYVSGTGGGWVCSAVGQAVTCTNNLATLASGASLPSVTLTVAVGAAAPSSLSNTATISSTTFDSDTTNSSSTALTSVGTPTITKSFNPTVRAVGQGATLTLTVTNSTATPLTGIAFNDPFPTNLVVAGTPNLVNTCGGTPTGGAATNTSVGLTGGILAANSSCTITVDVTSAVVGTFNNTATGVASTQTGAAGAVSNTAVLDTARPQVSKAFAPDSIIPGGSSLLTITLSNIANVPLTGVVLNDTFPTTPGAMTVASPLTSSTTCGGVLSNNLGGALAVGSAGVRLTGGSIPANGSCVITVLVTATTVGGYNNIIPVGGVTTTNGGPNTVAANAVLTVPRPGIAKFFAPAGISTNTPSTLTITLTNTSATAYIGAMFTDTYPTTPGTGVRNTATPNVTNTCSGVVTAAPNGGSVGLTGGIIPANGSCQITVEVSAAAGGTYTNSIGAGGLTTTNGGSNASATSAQLVAAVAPDLQMTKTATGSFVQGSNGTYQLTVNNTLGSAATTGTITVVDVLPAGLTYVSATGTAWACSAVGQTVTCTRTTAVAAAGTAPVITLTVAVGAAAVPLVSNTATVSGGGETNNTNNNGNATTVVIANPSISKVFAPSAVAPGVPSTLTFTLTNPNAGTPLTGVNFSDSYPGTLVNATSPSISNTCGGTLSGGTAGTNTIGLTGVNLAASATCTISVQVSSPTANSFANVSGAVGSTNGGTGNTANATLIVAASPTILKTFTPSSVLVNGTSTLSLTLSNPNSVALTGVGVSDTFPTGGMQVAATPALSNACGGSITGATAGSTSLSLAGGTIAASSNCTITVAVTSTLPGIFSNTTSGVSSVEAATGTAATPAVLTVTAPDLRLVKTHTGNFSVGVPASYTLTVNNTLGTAPTSGVITVVDTLPTGLTYVSAGSGGTGWVCGAAGQIVTCTSSSVIATGATSANPITLNVTAAATAKPTVTNAAAVSGGGEPAVNNTNNNVFDPTLVVDAPLNTFLTDGSQTALPGTVVFFTHIFNAGLTGNVAFSSTHVATPALAGWSTVIYRDTNCNAVLDGTEGTTPLSTSVAVTPGSTVCLVVKVFIPAAAPFDADDLATITATFTPSSGPPVVLYTRTDLTTVGLPGGAGLNISKTVKNITTGGTSTTANTARPGDTIEYTITYNNTSASPIGTIVINDTTPAFTQYVLASCVTPLPTAITACVVSTQPPVNGAGAIVWTLTGSLAPGATGSVVFRVQL